MALVFINTDVQSLRRLNTLVTILRPTVQNERKYGNLRKNLPRWYFHHRGSRESFLVS